MRAARFPTCGASVAETAARRCSLRRSLIATALIATALTIALPASPARAQIPELGPQATVDGPSAEIRGLAGMSVARDGTGGLVYVKQLSGVSHVFVSRLLGGLFGPPEQVDSAPALIGPSSQPVIAAGNGGLLLIGFINGGALYVVDRLSATAPYTAPAQLFAGAMNPALQMTNVGKASLAFTADAGGGNHDVRAAYYDRGQWALEPSPLDAVGAENAGTGTGRPWVAASGDGVGIVVWGEAGHVYSRRVWGTSPSLVYEQADVPALPGVPGWSEVSADEPAAGVGGDSSYVDVVFHEVLTDGSQQQSRVLMRRLRGSQYEGVTQPDGLSTPGPEGSDQPRIAMAEYGTGFVTSARDASNELFATVLGGAGSRLGVARVDSLPNTTPAAAVPATAGLFSDLIAWQQNPGTAGPAEIRVRYSPDGETLGPELIASSPALGPTDAAKGLAAAGDVDGNAAIAWVQGTAGSRQIVAAQLYQQPGAFDALSSLQYARINQPLLAWSPARAKWGPLRYLVSIDGIQVSQTTATSVRVPSPLPDGPHRWQVTAVNPAGLSSASDPAIVWVDTLAPFAHATITGKLRVGSPVHVDVSYTDAPPPGVGVNASGISEVLVNWGDGSAFEIVHGKFHIYRRAKLYKVTVVVTDRAGNATTLVGYLRIVRRTKHRAHIALHPQARARIR